MVDVERNYQRLIHDEGLSVLTPRLIWFEIQIDLAGHFFCVFATSCHKTEQYHDGFTSTKLC